MQPQTGASGGDWNGFLKSLRDVPPMIQSFLRKPDAVAGVFEENSLTLWVDSELTKGVLSKADTTAMLERAAEAYTGRKRRVIVKVGRPEPAAPTSQPVAVPQKEEDKFNDLLALGRQFGNFTVK